MQGASDEPIGGGGPHEALARDEEVIGVSNRGFGLLRSVATWLAMGLVFFTLVVPIGLVMRALGKDKLRLRRDPGAASYWIDREPPGPAPGTMKNQS
jgi:hypothetical protein